MADVTDERKILFYFFKKLIIMLILMYYSNNTVLYCLLIIAIFNQDLYEISKVKIYKFMCFGQKLILMYFFIICKFYKFFLIKAAKMSKNALFIYKFKFLAVQLILYFWQARFWWKTGVEWIFEMAKFLILIIYFFQILFWLL